MSNNMNYHSFSRVALRFFFRILFGIVLCIVMYGTFFSFFDAEWYQRLLGVLVLALLVFMLYTGMWSTGIHDKDEIFFQRMKRNPLRGIAISAIVSIPYVLLNSVLLFNCLNAISDEKYASTRLIFNLINSPFLFITLNFDYHEIEKILIAAILLPLTIIAVGGASYYLGLKNISILQFSVYKDEKRDHENRNK